MTCRNSGSSTPYRCSILCWIFFSPLLAFTATSATTSVTMQAMTTARIKLFLLKRWRMRENFMMH